MKCELSKAYNSAEHEDKIYQKWENTGYFNPDNLSLASDAKNYTIILPPPNITAKLHIGHSAMLAIEDLLIRYHRLLGERALWLPGTDHAAIATQSVVEKKILKESGKTRHDLGREKFLAEVWKFVKETQGVILNQTKKMGSSLDWSRLAFTLDEQRQKAVSTMFISMYNEGVIYRGERVINWCPRCHSTLADDEVEHKDETAKLYWIKYGPFILATSRPETKLGDTAVAVHPSDERYKKYIGQELDIEGVLGSFKVVVVADYAVDMDFGSGAIKVTPAHSFIDNEIAQRHNLPSKKIINEDGRMMDNCGKYAGLTTKEAREAIVEDMLSMGFIDHIDENYEHSAAVCYRCDTVIEPLPSKQWFISVDKKLERLGNKSLKEKALEAVEKRDIEFLPERFNKSFKDWMTNLHDWCISRQIWFGHELPVWYKNDDVYVGENAPTGEGWIKDEDTLDTWFSSGMWTFSTLGWPDNLKDGVKTGDLARFHPTQVLETGYEILTLWVSRMIMMSFFALNEIPFEHVYLHGTILDKDGKKMSKSKGNGVDPLEVIEKYGADSLRLALLMGSTPGNDSRYSEDKVAAKRNFINKFWNISRFILGAVDEKFFASSLEIWPIVRTEADAWIIKELDDLIRRTTARLNNFEFSLAAEDLFDFTWNKLADWYLEIAKIEKDKEQILIYVLRNILILWHPFIPYVTETIWASFNDSLLMVAGWPQPDKSLRVSVTDDFNYLQEVIVAIRNARSANKIEASQKLMAVIYGHSRTAKLESNRDLISGLRTGLSSLEIKEKGEKIKGALAIVIGEMEIYLLVSVDVAQEKDRLIKEKSNLEKLLDKQSQKLANAEFMSRAPEKIVTGEKEKLDQYALELKKIVDLINNL
ncbi:MAG: valine--tRNA ligase [Patescibacteria group bacterium]